VQRSGGRKYQRRGRFPMCFGNIFLFLEAKKTKSEKEREAKKEESENGNDEDGLKTYCLV
jgi:hypothetical protein